MDDISKSRYINGEYKGRVIRMKRIMSCILIVFILLMDGSFSKQVEASDYYIGKYNDGNEAYLVTDSINETLMSHNGYFDGYRYDCKVKSVFPDTREYYYTEYTFMCGCPGGPPGWTKDGTEYRKCLESDYPVEFALISYFYNLSQNRHPNQWKSEKVLSR